MKKIVSSFLISSFFLLALSPVPYSWAQTTFTIPAQAFQAYNEGLKQDVTSFLTDQQIIKRCLRNRSGQEAKPVTAYLAACFALNAFDETSYTLIKSWSIAQKTELFDSGTERSDQLNTIEFLSMLFKTAGVSIPASYEADHIKSLKAQGVTLRKEDLKTLAIAIESGIFAPPYSKEDGRRMKRSLNTELLSIGDALTYIYQTWSTQDNPSAVIEFNPFPTVSTDRLALENILKQVVRSIKGEGYYGKSFDEKKAMEAAIKALVNSIEEDKYMEYYTVDEYSNFSSNLNGSLEGIGAYVEEKEGKIIIVSPIEGGPASKVGIHAGDIITRINGESTEGISLQEAINVIRGPKGTNVDLTIDRKGVITDFTITRDKITIPALTTTVRDNVTIIKLTQFNQTSDVELMDELAKVNADSSAGIIIDLRNNPGGFLNQVVNMVDFFIEAGQPAVYIKDRVMQDSINTVREISAPKVPLSIIINKGSASASEILAGVLQSYGIAKVYGETSFGKGTVQNIKPLQDASQDGTSGFKYTIAEYLIPNPNGAPFSIDGVGVKPGSNPNGPESSMVDNPETPSDEVLDEVILMLKRDQGRSLQFR